MGIFMHQINACGFQRWLGPPIYFLASAFASTELPAAGVEVIGNRLVAGLDTGRRREFLPIRREVRQACHRFFHLSPKWVRFLEVARPPFSAPVSASAGLPAAGVGAYWGSLGYWLGKSRAVESPNERGGTAGLWRGSRSAAVMARERGAG